MRVMDQFDADVRDLFEKFIITGTLTNLVVYSYFILFFIKKLLWNLNTLVQLLILNYVFFLTFLHCDLPNEINKFSGFYLCINCCCYGGDSSEI